jgi:hypothetical protein
MSFEGSLQDTNVPTVFEVIGDERHTGILTIQDDREIVAVTFLKGEIVGVDALVEQEEALGAFMAEEGLVARDDFAAVLDAHRSGGGKVTDLLVDRGLVPRPDLLAVLRRHALARAQDLLEWRSGTYKFYAGDEVAFEDGFEPIAVDELLGSNESQPGVLPSLAELELDTTEADEEIRSTAELGPRDERVLEIERALANPRSASDARSSGALEARAAAAGSASGGGGKAPSLTAPVRSVTAAAARAAAATKAAATTSGGTPRPRRVEAARILRRMSATGRREEAWPIAIAILVTLAGFLVWRSAFVLPLPWNREVRENWSDAHRDAMLRRIDASARAFHLVEGGYPTTLKVLADEGLLRPSDLRGPLGETLDYSPSGASYAVRFTEGERMLGAPSVETTAGDFLLDPLFIQSGTESRPLVLLD